MHIRGRGFSLVELTLTIVILGILAAVTLPKFYNQATFEERFFYDDLLAASRYASKLAIGSGCAVQLSVGAAGYSLAQDSNCNFTAPNFSITVLRPDDGSVYANSDVPSTVTINASNTTLVFRPDHQVVTGAGTPISTASIQLNGDIARLITIYGSSAYVAGL
jgi:MSHA pilin protein MshC